MSNHERSPFRLTEARGITFLLVGVLMLLVIGLTLLVSGLAVNVQVGRTSQEAQTVDQRMIQIGDKLQCPICEGQSVAFSNSQLAAEMRRTIAEKLEAGESEAQIMDYFVARYGVKVLREPPRQGLNMWLWLTPIVAFALAALWLARMLRRMARMRPAAEEMVDDAPDLDAEVEDLLAQYDEELFAR